jgi:hypothetical protein
MKIRLHDWIRMYKTGHKYMGRDIYYYVDMVWFRKRKAWSL